MLIAERSSSVSICDRAWLTMKSGQQRVGTRTHPELIDTSNWWRCAAAYIGGGARKSRSQVEAYQQKRRWHYGGEKRKKKRKRYRDDGKWLIVQIVDYPEEREREAMLLGSSRFSASQITFGLSQPYSRHWPEFFRVSFFRYVIPIRDGLRNLLPASPGKAGRTRDALVWPLYIYIMQQLCSSYKYWVGIRRRWTGYVFDISTTWRAALAAAL